MSAMISKTNFELLDAQIYSDYTEHNSDNSAAKDFVKKVNEYMKTSEISQLLKSQNVAFKTVVLCGSSGALLQNDSSDVDLVMVVEKLDKNAKADKVAIFKKIVYSSMFLKAFGLKGFVVAGAEVPIIKAESKEFSIDIGLHMEQSLPGNLLTTMAINAYRQLNPHFGPFATFVKKWSKQFFGQKEIARKVAGVIPNSYSMVVLAIHFMQSAGLLPNLVKEMPTLFDLNQVTWDAIEDINQDAPLSKEEVEQLKKNLMREEHTAEQLFISFLFYYNTFDFARCGIDMKEGEIVSLESATDGIVVQDSYDRLMPTRRIKNSKDFKGLIARTLKMIGQTARKDCLYGSILNVPFNMNTPLKTVQKKWNTEAAVFQPSCETNVSTDKWNIDALVFKPSCKFDVSADRWNVGAQAFKPLRQFFYPLHISRY